MRLVTVSAPGADPRPLLAAYRRHLERTGRGNASYWWAARDFFSRWPDPAMWAAEPLEVRLSASSAHRPVITFLMIHGHLRPGYDYLLERKISSLWRELDGTPLGEDLARVLDAAAAARVQRAGPDRERVPGPGPAADPDRPAASDELTPPTWTSSPPPAGNASSAPGRAGGTTSPGSASPTGSCSTSASWPSRRSRAETGPASRPARRHHPGDRRGHDGLPGTEAGDLQAQDRLQPGHPADALRPVPHRGRPRAGHAGGPGPAAPHRALPRIGRRCRRQPERTRDHPRRAAAADPRGRELPHRHHRLGLGRRARPAAHLPRRHPASCPGSCRATCPSTPTGGSPTRCASHRTSWPPARCCSSGPADCGSANCSTSSSTACTRSPAPGAWLKVPLGKLDSERMVPLDEETLALIDTITEIRSPGRPLPHPRYGRPAQFLFTHHGRRLSQNAVRDELVGPARRGQRSGTQPSVQRRTGTAPGRRWRRYPGRADLGDRQ